MPFASESFRTFVEKYLAPVSVVILVASLFTTGLISFELFSLSVTSWDLAVILLAVNAAFLLLVGDRSRLRISRPVIVLAAAFGAWVIVEAARSPQEFRGMTMAVLMLRNYVMVFSLLVIFRNAVKIDWFNRSIFVTGFVMAVIAIILFMPNAGADATTDRRPFGSIIILFDEFVIPRLTGFISDPNFFAMSTLIAVFFVFAFKFSRPNLIIMVGTSVMIAAVVLTFSRASYAALLAGLAALLLIALFQNQLARRRQVLVSFATLLSVSVVTFVVVSQIELNVGRSVWELTTLRFDRIADSPRFTLWKTLVDDPDGTDPVGVVSTEPTATPAPAPTATPVPEPTAASQPTTAPEPTAASQPTAAPEPTAEPQPTVAPEPTAAPVVASTAVPTAVSVAGTPQPIADESPSTAWRTVFGNGLRSNEVRLNTYSHNSYLDVSQEMGIVGTALWGAIAALIAVALFRYARTNSAGIPWLPAYAVILVMMGSLSMLFMPYFWIVAAVAIHVSGSGSTETGPATDSAQLEPDDQPLA